MPFPIKIDLTDYSCRNKRNYSAKIIVLKEKMTAYENNIYNMLIFKNLKIAAYKKRCF
jgi:hypothetical protein